MKKMSRSGNTCLADMASMINVWIKIYAETKVVRQRKKSTNQDNLTLI